MGVSRGLAGFWQGFVFFFWKVLLGVSKVLVSFWKGVCS